VGHKKDSYLQYESRNKETEHGLVWPLMGRWALANIFADQGTHMLTSDQKNIDLELQLNFNKQMIPMYGISR
jgi:hypothetical protein